MTYIPAAILIAIIVTINLRGHLRLRDGHWYAYRPPFGEVRMRRYRNNKWEYRPITAKENADDLDSLIW